MPPPSTERRSSTAADLAACRGLLQGGSRSFFAASLFLFGRVRDAATALYAFCRLADDAIDGDGGRDGALTELQERLSQVYAGTPFPIAADRAFADVVAEYAIPQSLPAALLEGFAWDADARRYPDLADVYAYSAHVAGSVGAMMALIMGRRAPEVVARACDLGVAMQLTNIARDVGEDARAGRLYLPLDWLHEAGIDADAWMRRPRYSDALGSVVQRLLRAADVLYLRASAGIAGLPLAFRPGIHTARLMYAGIGREVSRRRFDSVSQRAVVSIPRKAWLLAGAFAATLLDDRCEYPPLAETRFLVEAVVNTPAPLSEPAWSPRMVQWWNLYQRAVWVIDLFERIERRAQLRHAEGGMYAGITRPKEAMR